jgi:uncharacterized protein involved in exopolysaccharide biosynthesis/Mrp family chromosome partitioning ATPase
MFDSPARTRPAADRSGDVAAEAAPPDLDLKKIALTLWRGKLTILASIVAAMLLAAAFALLAPRHYTAVTQILIDPTDFRAVGGEVAPPNQQSDATVLQVESQVRVLGSDNVLRRVVNAEGLDHDGEFTRGAPPDQAASAALDTLRRRVAVKRPERTYVAEVNVTSAEAAKAVRLANAVAQAYLAEQTDVRADAARQVSQSLSARLKELQDRVRAAEQKVEAYKASHDIAGANGALLDEQQLADLNGQLGAARARTAEAKARLDQVESVQQSKTPIGAFPEAVQSQTISLLHSQYAEIIRREAEQKSSLGERHPAVIEIEAQAERLARMIDDEVNRIALSARAEYQRAKDDETALAQRLTALKNTALSTNQSLVGLRELERDVQANRAVYEAFLVRARETGEQEQVDTKNIRVISKADLPLQRSFPPSNLMLALAAVTLGALAGAGIALFRAVAADDTAPTNAAPREESPKESLKPNRRDAATKRSEPEHAAASPLPVLARLPQADVAFGLDAIDNPRSRFAREINKVYDAIAGRHDKRGNPSVLVVACDDEDDTVAVALTLAAAAAAKERVLLIDADLQRRTLAAIDADRGDTGLVDVAVGRRALADVIVRDRDTNINLVPFVAPNSRRAGTIHDADIRQAFAKTRRFDMVIVAAMELGRDPGTLFFADLVDHIVVVARATTADQHAVAQFMTRLGTDADKVCGTVLTGVDAAA